MAAAVEVVGPLLGIPHFTEFRDLSSLCTQVCVDKNGVHRAISTPECGLDYALDGAFVRVYGDPEATGLSCYVPAETPHDVPHSKLWNCPCGVLCSIGSGIIMVYDFDMKLRSKLNKKKKMQAAAHVSLFTTVSGKSVEEFCGMMSFVPCAMLGAGGESVDIPEPDDSVESPAVDTDLQHVSDALIKKLYRVAVYAYGRVPGGVKIVLNDIITTIGVEKPVVALLHKYGVPKLRLWLDALIACDSYVGDGAFAHIGPVQTMLEIAINTAMMVPTDDMDDVCAEGVADDVSRDPTFGVLSTDAMDYIRGRFLEKSKPVAGLCLLLTKVLFLADAETAARSGKWLLDERAEAWVNGPCYPRARNRFNSIRESVPRPVMDREVMEVLDFYLHKYMRVSARDLVEAIHATALWRCVPKGCNHVITLALMDSAREAGGGGALGSLIR